MTIAAQSDVFSRERGAIFERMECALHPGAPWRDEREAWSPQQPKTENTPWAHTMGAACTWLRTHPYSDEPPAAADALWCMVMQDRCATEMLRVATALAREWRRTIPRVRVMQWGSPKLGEVEYAAGIIVIRCTHGVITTDRPKLDWPLWRRLQDHGSKTVWEWAEMASRRASKALK